MRFIIVPTRQGKQEDIKNEQPRTRRMKVSRQEEERRTPAAASHHEFPHRLTPQYRSD